MSLYAIEDGNHTPKWYVKSIHKALPYSYEHTTDVNLVLEYTDSAIAQADSDFCDAHFGERFHVVPTPKH